LLVLFYAKDHKIDPNFTDITTIHKSGNEQRYRRLAAMILNPNFSIASPTFQSTAAPKKGSDTTFSAAYSGSGDTVIDHSQSLYAPSISLNPFASLATQLATVHQIDNDITPSTAYSGEGIRELI
jgi:hypothetical protein